MVFLNAGHYIKDNGAVHKGRIESVINREIRDSVLKRFPNCQIVPDEMDLRQSIEWVNERASEDDLAVSIHTNANNNTNVSGTEAYYAQNDTLARLFAEEVSRAQGIANRGARHDSETHVGSLGWLRKLGCKSVLVECFYLTNDNDYANYNPDKVAEGIVTAIEKHLQIYSLQQRVIKLLKQVVELLKAQLNKNV